MQNKFRTRICSDLEYTEMVADICYEEQTIAIITQENGIEKMEIEIVSSSKESKARKFYLDDYVAAIISAKEALIKMQKVEDIPSDENAE